MHRLLFISVVMYTVHIESMRFVIGGTISQIVEDCFRIQIVLYFCSCTSYTLVDNFLVFFKWLMDSEIKFSCFTGAFFLCIFDDIFYNRPKRLFLLNKPHSDVLGGKHIVRGGL